MRLVEIDVRNIEEAKWNPNRMDEADLSRLRESIQMFGFIQPLVVREISQHKYETVGGAQRLSVIKELGVETVDCVVVETDDAETRLLAQALNLISGNDDPAKRQKSLDLILEKIPRGVVLELLPDAADSIGQAISFTPTSLIEHLEHFERSRKARLRHFSAQLPDQQLPTVDQAIAHASEHGAVDDSNPNRRGTALFHICQVYVSSIQTAYSARL